MNGNWGSVCDTHWSLPEAQVVCKQLGYKRSVRAVKGSYFSSSDLELDWLDQVQCDSGEESILDCPSISAVSCSPGNEAGVVCSSGQNQQPVQCISHDIQPFMIIFIAEAVTQTKLCSNGETRIRGDKMTEGRVEVCVGGEWGTVCSRGWGYHEAAIVCRQQGFNAQGESAQQRVISVRSPYLVISNQELKCWVWLIEV